MLITSLIRIYLLLSINFFNHLASTPELKLYGFHTDIMHNITKVWCYKHRNLLLYYCTPLVYLVFKCILSVITLLISVAKTEHYMNRFVTIVLSHLGPKISHNMSWWHYILLKNIVITKRCSFKLSKNVDK